MEERRVSPDTLISKRVTLSEACATLMAMGTTSPDGVHMLTNFDK